MPHDPFAEPSRKLLAAVDFAAELAELERAHRRRLEELLLSLLEVRDAFDRLLGEVGDGAAPPPAGVPAANLRTLARQLDRCLAGQGVEAVPCQGEEADPEHHEIVGVRPTASAAPAVIVELVSRGYRWDGRPLRRPRVIVAGDPEETPS